jgi:hypothetical protein
VGERPGTEGELEVGFQGSQPGGTAEEKVHSSSGVASLVEPTGELLTGEPTTRYIELDGEVAWVLLWQKNLCGSALRLCQGTPSTFTEGWLFRFVQLEVTVLLQPLAIKINPLDDEGAAGR